MRNKEIPDLNVILHSCPICGDLLDYDGFCFYCDTCEITWGRTGEGGRYADDLA